MDAKSANWSRHLCHHNFWRFASNILDKKRVGPVFSQEETRNYFNSLYQSQPKLFNKPVCMLSPMSPKQEFEINDIRKCECLLLGHLDYNHHHLPLIRFHV